MLARKHLVALAYQPLRSTINVHRRALCTQKGKIELEEEKKNEHQDKKEQGERENHKEQKHERAYKNYKKDEWEDEQKSKKWVPWVVGGSIAVGVFVGNYTYTRYQEDKAPQLAFERGHIPLLAIPKVPFIPKDTEISGLSKVIEASADLGQYLVIYGEHGCGKTTLIKQTCNSDIIRKHGCVYVSIPEPTDERKKGVKQVDAAEALAAPFRYVHRGLWSYIADAFSRTVAEATPVSPGTLKSTISLIERGAKEFTSLAGQQPILVIDNINYLATAAPLDLEALQDRAKEWADTHILTVIFVSSDGAAPPQLKGRSSYSRATEYFARGIPESVAVDYLCKNSKLEKETAEQVVRKLTGDRLHLIRAVSKCGVHSYSEIKAIIFRRVESDALKLLNSTSVKNTARAVITAILNSPSKHISFSTFQEIVSATIAPGAEVDNVIDTLRRSQVFFVDDKVVMFQSAGMLAYLIDNPPPLATKSPSTNRFRLF